MAGMNNLSEQTSEAAVDAMHECISRLNAAPLQILEALRMGFWRTRNKIDCPTVTRDCATITESMQYISEILRVPELPSNTKEHLYERFEDIF